MDVGLSADGCAQLIWIVCLCWVILLSHLYSFLNLQLLSFYVSSSFCSVIQPFSSCISSSSVFFFFPFPLLVHFHPSVTIATEERPSIEKGIRLAGPPSHLARRGGWGGGRSSGSMFELEALCTSTRHRSHSHSWPLTPSASPSAPIGGAARPHESAVPLTFDLQNCTWHESVLHYCVTTGRRRFCWVIASILLVKFYTFFSLTVRLINI